MLLLVLGCDHVICRDVSVMASLSIRLLCDHDVRFVYLSRCLRLWAKKHGLTNLQPGGYLINFSLTHLIIFYLQQLNILPTLEHIISAGKVLGNSGLLYFKSLFDRNNEVCFTRSCLHCVIAFMNLMSNVKSSDMHLVQRRIM